jgi:hypothetical protein
LKGGIEMRGVFCLILFIFLLVTPFCYAGFLDDIIKGFDLSSEKGPDASTVISGLKEALTIGTENAVTDVSQIDGYLANESIKILMPEKIQKVADVLNKVGYQQQVDDFVTSMNRAAEQAAPKAKPHFIDAIRGMTFDDAKKILDGSDTAATDYFKSKTYDNLYNEFRPIISSSMNEVGVTRYYKDMMGKYTSLPFVKEETLDLDHYTTNKALEGLFYMIGQEEMKIRTDPSARVTDLLKKVFEK